VTTPVVQHRLSPSGEFLGDPGLNAGPGTIGLIWRAHGSTTALTAPTTEPLAIPGLGGLGTFTVNMQVGYRYELLCVTDARPVPTNEATSPFAVYYRLHTASTSAWGSWLPLTDGGAHYVDAALAGTIVVNGDQMCSDARFGMAMTSTVDAIEFGVLATTADSVLIIGEHCYAKVIEYLP
jgi:hypothetical protein